MNLFFVLFFSWMYCPCISGIKVGDRRQHGLNAGAERALKKASKNGDESSSSSSSSEDIISCISEYPKNVIAATASTFLSEFWLAVTQDCTPEGVASAHDKFVLPDVSVTIFGQDVGINNLQTLKDTFVGDDMTEGTVVFNCSAGKIFSWYLAKVEIMGCTSLKIAVNEMISDGVSPLFDLPGETLPAGRDYYLEVDEDGFFLVSGLDIVCPFESGVNQCSAQVRS